VARWVWNEVTIPAESTSVARWVWNEVTIPAESTLDSCQAPETKDLMPNGWLSKQHTFQNTLNLYMN